MLGAASPRSSGQSIAAGARHVTVSQEGVRRCAEYVASRVDCGDVSLDKYFEKSALRPNFGKEGACDDEEAVANWVFFSDTLNFSFWNRDGDEQYEVTYGGTKYTGFLSMVAAINRTLDSGVNLTDPKVYRDIKEDALDEYLKGDGGVACPMISQRVKCLKGTDNLFFVKWPNDLFNHLETLSTEVGEVLCKSYGGSAKTFIERAGKSAARLLDMVVGEFPCFRDVAKFKGEPVSFLKRAQIFVADVWSAFGGTGLGEFGDISTLTMFADYRVPQSLQYFGVLSYSQAIYKNVHKMQCKFETGVFP